MPELKIADKAKDAAGAYAASLIKDGWKVGLGTGTTAAFFIKHLAKRCREGLKIKAVATSFASEQLALKEGIPLLNPDTITFLDVAVDGDASDVDGQNDTYIDAYFKSIMNRKKSHFVGATVHDFKGDSADSNVSVNQMHENFYNLANKNKGGNK